MTSPIPTSIRLSMAETARPAIKPRHAASLLLADLGDPKGPRFLMGQRSGGHVFMAHRLVFPGGRVERGDAFSAPAQADRSDLETIKAELGTGTDDHRASAFVTCALRETREETGLVLEDGAFLTPIRYLARAITPPGQVRRFDTRFFLVGVDRERLRFSAADGELNDVGWFGTNDDAFERLHSITRSMMELARDRLRDDPQLALPHDIPCFRMRDGRRVVEYRTGCSWLRATGDA